MTDIKINLYHGDRTDEPTARLEASYQDLAKMDNQEFVGRCKTAFSFDLTEEKMVLEIDEPDKTVHRNWMPFPEAEQEQMEQELEMQLNHLVMEWRA